MNRHGPILAFNAGSSSLKFRLFDPDGWRSVAGGTIERLDPSRFREAADQVLRDFSGEDLAGIGHRVVHGGDLPHATVIDPPIEQLIGDLADLAPLHNPVALAVIQSSRQARPDLTNVAVFDTAFHADLPQHARTYAIDRAVADRYGIRRYGFHGISLQHATGEISRLLGRPLGELRMIVLHLGNGSSMTAVDGGRSIDTSMGFTPSEGLVMGTRSGDIDPSVLVHLLRKGLTSEQLDDLINHSGGLVGLTGNQDMRDVLASAASGEGLATLALDVYLHRIRRYLGAYSLELGGVDAIAFTGGIGENSPLIRQRSLERMASWGVQLDDAANEAARSDSRIVSTAESSIAVLVIRSDEEREIARQTQACLPARHPHGRP